MLYDPRWEKGEGADDEGEEFIFCYKALQSFKGFPELSIENLKDIPLPEGSLLLLLLRHMKQTNTAFPVFDNFSNVIEVADQFLNGMVQTHLLQAAENRAAEDLEKIKPFVQTFLDARPDAKKNDLEGFPNFILVFGYALQLSHYIADRIDEQGLVIGFSPLQRQRVRYSLDREDAQKPNPKQIPPSPK